MLLGVEPEIVTGRGAGLSSEGLCRKIAAIKRAVKVNGPDAQDGVDVLAKVGGFDLAGLAGVFWGSRFWGSHCGRRIYLCCICAGSGSDLPNGQGIYAGFPCLKASRQPG